MSYTGKMRRLISVIAGVILSTGAPAQSPTPTAILTSPGSQANTAGACLVMSSSVQAPGALLQGFPGALGLWDPSTTFAYQCDGTQTGVSPGGVAYVGYLEGGGNQPFALAVSEIPAALTCGGPAGQPCMTQPSLFNSIPTPYGLFHLGLNFSIIMDGIDPTHPVQVSLNFIGRYTLIGNFPVDTAANGGTERRLAVQTLVADPGAANGFTLSACLTVDQWVSN